MKTHLDAIKNKYKCDQCELAFHRSNLLLTHIRTHIGEKYNKCSQCDYSTKYSNSLKIHMVSHSDERPFKCTICDYSCKTSATLKSHNLIHSEEKPFKCTICDYSCKCLDSLKVHIRRHNGEKNYHCEYENCNSSFVDASDLKKHSVSHSDVKPFKCNTCDESFSRARTLKKHNDVIHLQIKNFNCHICEYTCSFAHSLKLHIQTHTGEKNNICDQCDASFIIPCRLQQHKFIHHTVNGNGRLKKEESRILKLLENSNVDFKYQHTIDFMCLGNRNANNTVRSFIDFLVMKPDSEGITGIILLEVDEHQHNQDASNYTVSCDVRRMNECFESLILEGNTLPVVFIRYNPNSFEKDGKKMKISKRVREEKLLETIENFNFKTPVGVHYMYYDSIDNIPRSRL